MRNKDDAIETFLATITAIAVTKIADRTRAFAQRNTKASSCPLKRNNGYLKTTISV